MESTDRPESRLDAVLAAFERANDADAPLAYAELLKRRRAIIEAHPELADELRQYFADVEAIDDVFSPAGPDTQEFPQPAGPPLAPGEFLGYLGDYQILERLAHGGMGIVYRARQMTLDRIVAVKLIRRDQPASARERFRREALTMAGLAHPHIVGIHEVQEHNGWPYFSMEFLPGGSLAARLRSGPLPPREAATLLLKIAKAVSFAHEHGVLHRDLKPANILLDEAGEPHVTDFGLARPLNTDSELTGTGLTPGTPAYMSPEQVRGDKTAISTRSDLFSLGVILYQMLTGELPFTGATPFEMQQQILNKQPRPVRQVKPAIPIDLAVVCERCLEKEPQRRLVTCRELCDCLSDFLANRPISIRPVGRFERTWRWCRRNPLVAGLAVTLAVAASLAIVLPSHFAMQTKESNRELGIAVENLERANQDKDLLIQDKSSLIGDLERTVHEKENAVRQEKQRRVLADSLRLSTEARAIAGTTPIRATRLAIEAVRPFLSKPEECPTEIEQTLRDVASTLEGVPLPDAPAAEMWQSRLTPNGKHVYAIGRAERPDENDIAIWLWSDLDRIPHPPAPAELNYPGWPRSQDHERLSPISLYYQCGNGPADPRIYERSSQMNIVCTHDSRWLIGYCLGARLVRIWDLRTSPSGNRFHDLSFARAITDVQLVPYRNWLCVSESDHRMTRKDACLRRLRSDIHGVGFAHDREAVNEHFLFDLSAIVPTRQLAKLTCDDVWFSNDGRWLAAQQSKPELQSNIYELGAGTIDAPTLTLPAGTDIVFSPKSDWVLACSRRFTSLRRLPSLPQIAPTPAGMPTELNLWRELDLDRQTLAISPTGRWLVTGGGVEPNDSSFGGGPIVAFDLETSTPTEAAWNLGSLPQYDHTRVQEWIAFDSAERRAAVSNGAAQ